MLRPNTELLKEEVDQSLPRFVDVSKRQKAETETSINEILNKSDNKTNFIGRYVLGDKESPIKVVMISDYQCPDCLRFETKIS